MSLLRPLARSPAALGRQSARCFSNGPARPNDVMDILSRSPAQRHPANAAPAQPAYSPLSGSKLAAQMLTKSKRGAEMSEFAQSEDYSKHLYRRWNAGDVYAPHDLSAVEQKKWKLGRMTPQQDAFDVLGINPINEYKNYTLMSEFMTEMGRIKHSKQSGLRPVNQRKIAKAIRRAIGLGLMPSVHRHPLVLKKSHPGRFL